MKSRIIILASSILSLNIFASSHLDVYGVETKTSKEIIKKYSSDIEKYLDFLKLHQMRMMLKKLSKNEEQEFINILINMEKMKKEIKKKYNFLYVDFDTIYDPEYDGYFTTIEVIPSIHPERMRFLNPIINYTTKITKKQNRLDLIDEMIAYTNLGLQLAQNKELSNKTPECTVFHCFIGFTHKKLKPYLKIFNNGAIKEKELILNTLKNDYDVERRAAAIFLIGHFTNPKEIIYLLSPYVYDKNSLVRNNAMRVILSTMNKANISHINVLPFLDLLDSPYVSDRNKALYVLLEAVNSLDLQKLIKQKGGAKLISLLQSKQPNNHEPAYLILKKISGQNFSNHDVASWKKWLVST